MADAKLQAEFDREFRGHIERFTESLVAALRHIVKAKPPSQVQTLSFEIQADWDEFPVRVFAMDSQALNEVYFRPPFKGQLQLLSDAGELIPNGAIDQDRYETAGVATYESGAEILAEWFGECWHTVGGPKFPLPAYINLHDSSRYYDLHALRWVKDTDIGKS